jgi:hypothetical protein
MAQARKFTQDELQKIFVKLADGAIDDFGRGRHIMYLACLRDAHGGNSVPLLTDLNVVGGSTEPHLTVFASYRGSSREPGPQHRHRVGWQQQ